jgi:hypothetical protein
VWLGVSRSDEDDEDESAESDEEMEYRFDVGGSGSWLTLSPL